MPELDGLGELRAERSGEGEGSMVSMDRFSCLSRRVLGVLLSDMSRGSSERRMIVGFDIGLRCFIAGL